MNNLNTRDTRIQLNPTFQKEIFIKLLKRYGRFEISKKLNISSSELYHYKNGRVNNISKEMLDKITALLNINQDIITLNTLFTFSRKSQIDKAFIKGRELRRKQLREFRNEIPKINEIVRCSYLNLEKWFSRYQKLTDFGARKIKNIEKRGNVLKLTYTNYSKRKKKLFTTLLPRKIRLDKDFQYFFGLWVGDKSGGGRFGVMNKEKTLNHYTANFIKKLYQKPVYVLHIHNEIVPKLDYKIDQIVKINSARNGYAISVHTINGFLKSFFEYLEENLDKFLDLIPNKNIFFAGLFDAEGNVSLEDKCFRWSSKNETNIRIFTKHLTEMELFDRFDGCNLVAYNKELFLEKILPFIKHPDKINAVNIVCFKQGVLPKRFLRILCLIKNNPGKTAKEIAKALKRVKVSSQLNVLEDNDYIYKKEYPNKMYITDKGVASFSHGGKDL